MRLRADFHTHTVYCDGANTPVQMAEAAWRMGFTDFGFSGHEDFSFCTPGFGLVPERFEQYRKEILQLKEQYAGRMNIYLGIERDCLGPGTGEAEYVIGSTHCIEKNGNYVSVDDTEEGLCRDVERLWGGDWYAFARDYFELEATVGERTRCDWVGHFDLLTKFNERDRHFDTKRDDYIEPALTAMKRLCREGLPFEINTGAISRGYRTVPYPSAFLLKELCSMGGRIIITSDSHSARTIGWQFDMAQKLAWECGFRKTLVLKPGGGFREIEL